MDDIGYLNQIQKLILPADSDSYCFTKKSSLIILLLSGKLISATTQWIEKKSKKIAHIYVIVHLVLGFYFMHQTYNRDAYVTILSENIMDGYEGYFVKQDATVVKDFETPYDYYSLMAYGAVIASKNGLPTIIPKVILLSILSLNWFWKLFLYFHFFLIIGRGLSPYNGKTAEAQPKWYSESKSHVQLHLFTPQMSENHWFISSIYFVQFFLVYLPIIPPLFDLFSLYKSHSVCVIYSVLTFAIHIKK